jgi:hypothetical protein
VARNATGQATAGDGREMDGDFANLAVSVEADSARGGPVSIGCSHRPLLDTLQTIMQDIADFDLVQTGEADFEFRYYPGQLGSDRTGDVVFALERGNVGQVSSSQYWTGIATAAIVAGQGHGDQREIEIVQSPDWSSANHSEIFVDANDIPQGETARLVGRGLAKLAEAAPRQGLEFLVIPSQSVMYGREWALGDLVTGRYRDQVARLWVDEVTVAVENGAERIAARLKVKEYI